MTPRTNKGLQGMRKLTWALAAAGCLAAAFAVGSSLVATAGPAGNGAALAAAAQNAATQVADRFPGEAERFRTAELIEPGDRGFFGAIAHANSGRVNVPGCNTWPFLAAECLTTHAKPAQTRAPAAAAPRTTMPIARTNGAAPVRAHAPAQSRPAAVSTPSCRQNLATVSEKLEKALARLKGARPSGNAEVCAAYQQDFFIAVQAREVTALCKSGAERD